MAVQPQAQADRSRSPAADADPPPVSVVVTVRNDVQNLPNLLSDLKRLDWPRDRLEVVLIDAYSTDGTWELIQEFKDRAPFTVKAAQRRGSIGAGRNAGFSMATGEFVAVTDADMRVPEDWLTVLVGAMEPGIGVVGGPNNRATHDLKSRAVSTLPVHGPTRDEVPVWGTSRYLRDFTTDADIYACVTRNSLFRREAFQEAGGFDEDLVATEDPELNQRILKAGWRLRFTRDAPVEHVHRQTLKGFLRQQKNYAVGQALANAKHPEMFGLKQVAPLAAAVAFVAALVLGLLAFEPFLWVAWLLLAAVLVLTLAYSARAAVATGDWALVVALPVFFLAWQAAWVVGYPLGVLRRRSRRKGGAHRA